jgi:hypothetical protein
MSNSAFITYHIFERAPDLNERADEYMFVLRRNLDQRGVVLYGDGHVRRVADQYLQCIFSGRESTVHLAGVPLSLADSTVMLTVSVEADLYSSEYVKMWIGCGTHRDDLGVISPERLAMTVRQFADVVGMPCKTHEQQVAEFTENPTMSADYLGPQG